MAQPVIYNYQTFIQTHYIGQTETKPSRVKAVNVNTGNSAIVSWDHGLDIISNHLAAATKLYENQVIEGGPHAPRRVVVSSMGKKGFIFTAHD